MLNCCAFSSFLLKVYEAVLTLIFVRCGVSSPLVFSEDVCFSRTYSRCLSYYNMFWLLLCLWCILTTSSRLDLFWCRVMLLRPYQVTIPNMRTKSERLTSRRHYEFLCSDHQFHSIFPSFRAPVSVLPQVPNLPFY